MYNFPISKAARFASFFCCDARVVVIFFNDSTWLSVFLCDASIVVIFNECLLYLPFLSIFIVLCLELHHEIRVKVRASKTSLSSPTPPPGPSVFLQTIPKSFEFFLVCASVVLYVAFVLSLFVREGCAS